MESGSGIGQCQLLALLPFTVWCLLPICLTEGPGQTLQSAPSSSPHKHTMLYCACFSAHVPMCVRAHALPGGEVLQAGGDVLAVIIDLFRVEGALTV